MTFKRNSNLSERNLQLVDFETPNDFSSFLPFLYLSFVENETVTYKVQAAHRERSSKKAFKDISNRIVFQLSTGSSAYKRLLINANGSFLFLL